MNHRNLCMGLMLTGAFGMANAESINTRFGPLEINEENTLLYKGRPFVPEIQGNSGLHFVGVYQQGGADAVLIQDVGGTACPAQYQFVSVTASKAVATPSFGTCSDIVDVTQTADSVTVTMPGFSGPFESKAAAAKAAKRKHRFVYRNGGITEVGTPRK